LDTVNPRSRNDVEGGLFAVVEETAAVPTAG
jgi:hypothetical protein